MTEMKDSVRNLLETKEGVIHLVNMDNFEAMNQTSAPLTATESEIEKFDIKITASEEVKVPAIENAKARLEVVLHQHIPVGKTSQLMLLEVKIFLWMILSLMRKDSILKRKNLIPLRACQGEPIQA